MNEFHSRFEKALRASADTAGAGRLRGARELHLVDITDATRRVTLEARYELFGPGDVRRLAASAVSRRFPAPHASDAEVTKLALVEFAAADLAWRYTPERSASGALRPWLALIVGRRVPDEIVLRPDGRVTLGRAVQANHPLARSALWAHVHRVEGHAPIGRLLAPPATDASGAPLDYLPDTEYVACLVPAFTADGEDAWTGGRPVTLDLYDQWRFRTGPGGDFRELAKKLHRATLVPTPGGKPFGRADIAYRSRTTPATTMLAMDGALTLPRLPGDPPDPADAAVPVGIASETAALTRRLVIADGRAVLATPRYDAPFVDASDTEVEPPDGGWIAELRGDPRRRGAAGLGAWNAIEWQDRLADAVSVRIGEFGIAADRVRRVALGVEASRSLWRRRLPSEPIERLSVLLPALGRLLASTGQAVREEIAARTPGLGLAVFSSAARRAFRRGPARAALAGGGGGSFGAVLVAANRCPDEREDPAAIEPNGIDPGPGIERAVREAASGGGADDALADAVLGHLGPDPSAGALAAALGALAPGPDGVPDTERVARFLATRDHPEPDRALLDWRDWMAEHAAREPCRPLDLERLATLVAAAIDPTVARPPAVERVLATLPGIAGIGPLELEPELDLPLWSFLDERAPQWMLPGAADLEDGDVVALATNPAFVEALLVGANHQLVAELRWRNIALVAGASPLRKFWQRKAVEPDLGREGDELDITPIRTWPALAALGSAPLAPLGRAAEAVVAFRTALFRRYPQTVVYLYRRGADWMPPEADAPFDPARREDPTFTGRIGTDITFFGFAVAPEALRDFWVVLEEPPAGYRFYHEPKLAAAPGDAHSARYAQRRFAPPVRVLLGQLLGEPE